MADFTLKEGDLEPGIFATIADSFGVAVDITSATSITLRLSTLERGEIFEREMVVETPSLGTVSYMWQDGDTDIPDTYYAEIAVNWGGPRPQTYPPQGYLVIVVEPRL